MFASRYFPDRYFAPRYWPKVGQDAAPITFNNATQNWLSITPHLLLALGTCLWALHRVSP